MKKGGGKIKGGAYERLIAQKLSLWISNLTREDIFWRSSLSGGRATVHISGGRLLESQVGDLSAIHPLGIPLLAMFVVECKFYSKLHFDAWCYNLKGPLSKEWAKLLRDCAYTNNCKFPLMFAKENRKPDLVLTNQLGINVLKKAATSELPVNFYFPRRDVFGLFLRDFLTLISPTLLFGEESPPVIKRPRLLQVSDDE